QKLRVSDSLLPPAPQSGVTRGRKLQTGPTALVWSRNDEACAQTPREAPAPAGPAAPDARDATATDTGGETAPRPRARDRATAARGGARNARRRLGARGAPPLRRGHRLDREPRKQDVRAGARVGA